MVSGDPSLASLINLSGRRALVTGGGKGIGAAISRRLVEAGATVTVADLDPGAATTAADLGAAFVELHTGFFANAEGYAKERELDRLRRAATFAREVGLRVNAGHGLDYDNVRPIAELPHLEELNIGHSVVARSVFVGVEAAVREMLALVSGERA